MRRQRLTPTLLTLQQPATNEATATSDQPASVEPSPTSTTAATTDNASTPVASPDQSASAPSSEPAAATEPPATNHQLAKKLEAVDVDKLADELGVGKMLLKDVLLSLARPGRDPRDDLSPPVFRREIMKLEDLKPGMELNGTVLNVVDFGAFIDIGLSDSGLIHVSRLSDRFVSDPHDVVSVGDILTAWVIEVDDKRRRVSLTAIRPGTEKARPEKRPREKESGERRTGKAKRFRRDRDKPRSGGKQRGGAKKANWQPKKSKPKPVVPITDAMADGKEPMRTFSDLQQFYKKKSDPDEKKKNKKDKGESS